MFPKNVPIAITFLLLTVAQQDVSAADLHTNHSVDGRIFGGTVAQKGTFPYLASVWQRCYYYPEQFLCAGVIISSKTILTAAHCVSQLPPNHLLVAIGSLELDRCNSISHCPKHDVQTIITHKYFDRYTKRNNIALVKLDRDLIFSRSVAKIELGSFYVDGGNLGLLSGWGFVKPIGGIVRQLRYTVVQTITNEKCQSYSSDDRIDDSQLCTISGKEQVTCPGDSGGPLVIRNQVVGIVSAGHSCGTAYPDVFTRISSYADWIKENMS